MKVRLASQFLRALHLELFAMPSFCFAKGCYFRESRSPGNLHMTEKSALRLLAE